jgi:hypothetical protein
MPWRGCGGKPTGDGGVEQRASQPSMRPLDTDRARPTDSGTTRVTSGQVNAMPSIRATAMWFISGGRWRFGKLPTAASPDRADGRQVSLASSSIA